MVSFDNYLIISLICYSNANIKANNFGSYKIYMSY